VKLKSRGIGLRGQTVIEMTKLIVNLHSFANALKNYSGVKGSRAESDGDR